MLHRPSLHKCIEPPGGEDEGAVPECSVAASLTSTFVKRLRWYRKKRIGRASPKPTVCSTADLESAAAVALWAAHYRICSCVYIN